MILLQQYWHNSNVPMNSVSVEKFISNIVKNANVTSVTFTYDARNHRNTVAFEKWVLSQIRLFFNYSVNIKYENQPVWCRGKTSDSVI